MQLTLPSDGRSLDLFCIGNPLIDLVHSITDADLEALRLDRGIMHLVDAERRAGILEYLAGREPAVVPGGSGPNTAVSLASMGLRVALAGKVGPDEYGERYATELASRLIRSHLRTGTQPTGTSIILVTPDHERTMNTFLGANREFGPADLDLSVFAASRVFYFTGYMWDTEPQKAALRDALAAAREAGTTVVFDCADPFAVNRYRDEFLPLLSEYVDVVFANREEARLLLGTESPEDAVPRFLERVSLCAVKAGKRGSFVGIRDGATAHIPTFSARVVDTTGAGDMYAAGFLYGLLSGAEPDRCGAMASYAAARIVEQQGSQLSPERATELRAVLEDIRAGGELPDGHGADDHPPA